MKAGSWLIVALAGMTSVAAGDLAAQNAPPGGMGERQPIDVETRAAMAAAAIDAILEGGDEEGRWGALTRVLGVQDGMLHAPDVQVASVAAPEPAGLLADLPFWASEVASWRPSSREEVAIATGVGFAALAMVSLLLVGTVRVLRALVSSVFNGRARGVRRAPEALAVSRRAPKRGRARGKASAPALSRDAARLEARLRGRRVA